jgi:hypothetical protein
MDAYYNGNVMRCIYDEEIKGEETFQAVLLV